MKDILMEVLEYLAGAITLELKVFGIKMREQGHDYSVEDIMYRVMTGNIVSEQDYGEESLQDFRNKVELFEKVKAIVERNN